MALELVHDVHVLDPFSVAVNAANVGIFPALLSHLPLEQAVVHGVFHLAGTGGRASTIQSAGSREVAQRRIKRRASSQMQPRLDAVRASVRRNNVKMRAIVGKNPHCAARARRRDAFASFTSLAA